MNSALLNFKNFKIEQRFSQQLKYKSHVTVQSINANCNYVVLHARSRVTVWVKFKDLEQEYSRLLV